MHIEIRKRNGETIVEGDARPSESWQETATRLYNDAQGGAEHYIALLTDFPGGGTKHVQFGRSLPTGGTTLDELVVVSVRED